ncbi:Ig-like domain-containing protein [bacterium]|nr:Ig-like domain-containing protein [bacterium]
MLGKLLAVAAVVLLTGTASVSLQAQELSVENLPPVVVRTVPQSGDTAVDAATVKTVRITFSKQMNANSFSLVQMSPESFPKLEGQPKFNADGLTCEAAVTLEPGKTYVIWVNSQKFAGFKDASGKSAIPYLLVFKTK